MKKVIQNLLIVGMYILLLVPITKSMDDPKPQGDTITCKLLSPSEDKVTATQVKDHMILTFLKAYAAHSPLTSKSSMIQKKSG